MIEDILVPLVCERFKNEERYRNGHLRVINALPQRRVLGLHTPQMKQVAKELSRKGGREYIARFENSCYDSLSYEETVVWGLLINLEKCPIEERLRMVEHYVPVMDNWAVCDSFCANAKWMHSADKELLWRFLQRWFLSNREFEVRFSIVSAMCCFLDEQWLEILFEQIDKIDFDKIVSVYTTIKRRPEQPQQGTVLGSLPYYVRMGVAWLLATALAKFPERTREYVCSSSLPGDVIKLYVRKARESFRTRNVSALLS